jgi:hypothetical protein
MHLGIKSIELRRLTTEKFINSIELDDIGDDDALASFDMRWKFCAKMFLSFDKLICLSNEFRSNL